MGRFCYCDGMLKTRLSPYQNKISFNPIAGLSGEGFITKSAVPSWVRWGVCFPDSSTQWFSDLLEAQKSLGEHRRERGGL